MKPRATRTFVGAMALAALAVSPSAGAEKWDLSTEYNNLHFLAGGYEVLANRLKEESGGDFELFIHWGGALGYKSADHIDAVGGGAVQMADTSPTFLSGFNPLFSLSTLPFVVSSVEDARVLYEIAKPYYDKIFRKHNQVLLAAAPFPPTGIWSNKQLVTSTDIANLKIRTYDAMGHRTFTAAGALPVQVSYPDIVPQLAAGAIEAVLTSGTGGASLKFWEYINRFTQVNYAFPLQMLHVNLDAYDALSPTNRKALHAAAAALEEHDWNEVTASMAKTYAEIRAAGATVVEAPPPDLQKGLATAAEGVLNGWLEEAAEDGRAIIAEFRKRTGN